MNNTIKKLWESYVTESPMQTAEEKLALRQIILAEDKLHNSLNANQLKLLEKYSESINELNCICELNAFYKGVRFTASFLLEAFYD